MLAKLFDVGDNTITNRIKSLIEWDEIDVVKNLTTSQIPNSNGALHETTFYDLHVFNKLAMDLRTPKARELKSKFSDILVKHETGTVANALPQISETDTLMLQAFHCDDPLEYASIMKRRDALVHKTELKRSMTAIGKLGGIQKARNIAIQERDKAKQALDQKQKELDTVQNMYDEYREHVGEGQKRMSSAQLKANYPDKFGSFKGTSNITRFLKKRSVPFELSDCPDKSGYRYAIFDVEKALEVIDKG